MSKTENAGKPELINGIARDAQAEAAALLSKAQQYVKERQADCESKLKGLREEAEQKILQQTKEIQRSMQSSITVEKRRISLKIRDRLIREISESIKARLASLVGTPEYREILADWITEAALGLQAAQAVVNASAKERDSIDQTLLDAAAKRVEQLTGKKVQLTKAAAPPLAGQGVIVTAQDGKTAFNNQVQTRLLRYQSEIRKIIYDTLFKDEP